MNCQHLKSQLPDLLLDRQFTSSPEGVLAEAHLAGCAGCAAELSSLRSTMALMDLWQAPEPSAYFDTRMQVRLREAASAPPAGFWQRLSYRMTNFAPLTLKPLVAGVMAVAVVIGGATYAGVSFFEQPQSPAAQESATLRDLQSLDRNAQTIDDLNSLDQQLDQQSPDTGSDNVE